MAEPARLNPAARTILLDAATEGYVSAVTIWEMAIKARMGKLRLKGGFREFISEAIVSTGFDRLSIHHTHAERTAELPLHHRDPFDRLLVAQAQVEGLSLLTADAQIFRYDVDLVWAGAGRAPRRESSGLVSESRPRSESPKPAVAARRRPARGSR